MPRIAVTGATGQIAYSVLFRIANGDVFGKEVPIELHLYDLPGTERGMEGVVMELEDCAFPLLKRLHFGTDLNKAFDNVDLALLIGAKPRTLGMERSDLLLDNGSIFVQQGQALQESANKEAQIIVVGNPCNTNCLIAMHHAPKISPKHFHAMMRLDQNRASSLLARKAKVSVKEVSQMIIWGNHSATQVPDFTNARIQGRGVLEVIQDKGWLQGEFIEMIQKRGASIIEARGKSSAASAAHALIEAAHSLYHPTKNGEIFSSAIFSDGNPYGIEEGLIFGFPCRSNGKGNCEIVPDFEWDFFMKEKLAATQKELLSERACVQSLLKK